MSKQTAAMTLLDSSAAAIAVGLLLLLPYWFGSDLPAQFADRYPGPGAAGLLAAAFWGGLIGWFQSSRREWSPRLVLLTSTPIAIALATGWLKFAHATRANAAAGGLYVYFDARDTMLQLVTLFSTAGAVCVYFWWRSRRPGRIEQEQTASV